MNPTHLNNDVCKEQIFQFVFRQYYALLRNFLIFKFGNVARAEDMAQNAFVILWENCTNVSPDKAKSFVFTTAIRLSLNTIKHEKIVIQYENKNAFTDKNIETPEFVFLQKEFNSHLQDAINALPEKQREVFLLNRIEKQTYKEIADALEISVKAVEKRMHLAMEFLKNCLQEYTKTF